MNDQQFKEQLEKGGKFEDAAEPLIARLFTRQDEHAMIINTATSKTDQKHKRGQRLMYCQDTSASYMLPDVFIFSNGKQLCIEIKYKNKFYRHTDGELYGYIDTYKVEEYEEAVKKMGFDGIYYVFGEKTDRNVYFGSPVQAVDMVIPQFAEYKNPKGLFNCWKISELHTIGKW
ncbi:hypothetical protein NVP1081O_106 [Vibrio phage 1.081.O._10N.286.52.C2]|nr:hypothetical protein NVP1081O_106 [Vibrio phage 1.081.O._10N.286.52.C2]